jgi:serine/threonine protein kinase
MSLESLRRALADRYTIERELGAGGMATVYLAQDLKHDRKVAIKVLHPELAAAIGPERFLAEIRVTANLQHPRPALARTRRWWQWPGGPNRSRSPALSGPPL